MAAVKYLTPIDLNKNELQNPRIQNLATPPGSPVTGQLYYDTNDNILYWWNGTAWTSAAGQTLTPGSSTATTSYGLAKSDGAAATYARSDHTHGTPSLSANVASALTPGDTATNGTGTAPAKDDHKHSLPSFGLTSAMAPIPEFGSSYDAGLASTFSRTDHTHGLPAHNAAAHSAIKLSDLAAASADYSMGTFKLTSLGAPTADADAATKAYVDALAMGLTDFKQSVKAVSVSNLNFVSAYTIDNYSPAAGDRVLLAGQTDATQNGIYLIEADGSIGARATDTNSSGEISMGTIVFVEAGDVYGGTQFVCTGLGGSPWVPGTTTSGWTLFSRIIGNEAGNGLTQSSGVLNVGAGTGISVAADAVAVDGSWLDTEINNAAGSGLTGAGGVLAVGAGAGISVAADAVAVDTAVVARKYVAGTGPASSGTTWAITHGLNNRDVIVQVYDATTYAEVVCDIVRTSTTVVTLNFASTVTLNTLRAVVIG